ncbi:DUF2530 domain-containing protein [Williamsia soli]|uniref:DUF2530 domain-containing protein n=1 Tax=Williamsia soli TaxID=364929 RepID=UPI003556EA38
MCSFYKEMYFHGPKITVRAIRIRLMVMADHIPELPRRLTSPAPVIIVGMLGWLIATVVVAGWGLGTDNTLTICLVGLGVGLFGCFVVSLQKWAVRRGSRAAQQGLS